MVMTKASMSGEDRGGKPNPGTSKDGRLAKNKGAGKGGKRDQPGWAGDLAAKSAGLPKSKE